MRLNVEMDQQYSLDLGENRQLNIYDMDDDDTGYKNEVVELSDEQLLINIQKLQSQNNIKQSKELVKDLGRCSLDIEMELSLIHIFNILISWTLSPQLSASMRLPCWFTQRRRPRPTS